MSDTDRAFLNAAFVFGGVSEPDLSVFDLPIRARLEKALRASAVPMDRASVLNRLRAAFEAQKRADITKIHPSWMARALQDEPRSVQVCVLGQFPESIRNDIAAELAIAREEIERAVGPESAYRSIALAQSMSRLMGDLAVIEDEPPVIRALIALEPSAAPKMIRRIGILKWSTTSIPLPSAERIEFDRRQAWVESLGTWDGRFLSACQAELSRIKTLDERAINRLGLTTFSRLLTPLDPHRVRWTLQQIPYNTAKTIRSRMGDSEPDFPAILSEEARLFQATWIALWEEGAIRQPWPSETIA